MKNFRVLVSIYAGTISFTMNAPLILLELVNYRYGGTYLDSDVIVLKPLSNLNNTAGFEDGVAGKTLNGAVMVFRKHR